jgi:type II secretory pathway pseudopilin PulG
MTLEASRRRAFSLTEVLVVMALLVSMLVSIVGLMVGSSRQSAWGSSRLVMEQRARRLLAELVTTTYEVLLAEGGAVAPELGEPGDDPTYLTCLRGVEGNVQAKEVAPGLLRAQAVVTWIDAATSARRRSLRAERLRVQPTLALSARYAFQRPR